MEALGQASESGQNPKCQKEHFRTRRYMRHSISEWHDVPVTLKQHVLKEMGTGPLGYQRQPVSAMSGVNPEPGIIPEGGGPKLRR